MADLPDYEIKVYGDEDTLPDEAESLFTDELTYSRTPLPKDRPDHGKWRFACVCAVTEDGHVLGGVHMDMGPKNFGPLADERFAVIESRKLRDEAKGTLEEPLLAAAVQAARKARCTHIQGQVSWNESDDVAAFKACGFAVTDLTGPGERDLYFAMKPLDG